MSGQFRVLLVWLTTTIMRVYMQEPDCDSNPTGWGSCPIRDYIRGYIIFIFLDLKPDIYDQQSKTARGAKNGQQITWPQGLL